MQIIVEDYVRKNYNYDHYMQPGHSAPNGEIKEISNQESVPLDIVSVRKIGQKFDREYR